MNNIITALNKAFLKLKPSRSEINEFKANFKRLFTLINDNESEEYNKNLISDFLKDTYYKQAYFMNTKERKDLVIRNGALPDNTAGVIIETKKFSNKSEMVTCENLNAKALRELVWYFLGERITQKNIDIKHLIITNVYEWFIFDAQIFEKLFAQNKALVKHYTDFINGTALGNKTEHFYKEIAQPFIEKVKEELHYTYFNLKDFQSIVENDNSQDDNELIPLYKILSPQHLLKLPFVNDSNTLDKGFYAELLHIIGLAETKNGGQILIERPKEGERNEGTMLEETISKLHSLNKIKQLKNAAAYGETYEERLFNVALELNITWINRVLFLKLLEAQLIAYHKDNEQDYAFLNFNKITEYDILERLFFEVLAKDYNDRSKEIAAAYPKIPYLNSSLFEPTELEHSTLLISNLPDDKTIPLLPTTVLKDTQGKKRTGSVKSLQYLLDFLDAYDFSSEGSVEIQEENKTLINAAVLGLIFEKINGYKDGSFFTPGIITMYMCEESLRKATVQKFNEIKGWHLNNFDELKDRIDPFNKEAREEANAIINQIRICDPSVGSGHYLVSALNEFIAMKSDLKILQDEHKNRIHHQIKIENDELLVYEADNNERFFRYNPKNTESQIVQKTLFNEKKTIIENCLFGVDINPNSVKICRLRLWIELLKNAYYKNATELETLPNIDINIKNGNSLLSRFPLDTDLKTALKKTKISIAEYKNAFHKYQNAENKEQKWELEHFIDKIKNNFRTEINKNSKEVKELQKLKTEYFLKYESAQLFQDALTPAQEKHKKQLESAIEKIETEIEAINSNKIYENAFEWRFEFPQVLDDEGNYIGFDIVVGNPPYIKEYENRKAFDGFRETPYYKGKMDIWYGFACKGIDLLKQKGTISFIAQNNWVTSSGASILRNKILEETELEVFIDFVDYKVFESASIQTMIFLLQKVEEPHEEYYTKVSILKDKDITESQLKDFLKFGLENDYATKKIFKLKPKKYIGKTIHLNQTDIEDILEKIEEKGAFKLYDKEVAQGIVAPQDFVNENSVKILGGNVKKGDGIFVISDEELTDLSLSEKEYELIKPYYTSDELDKYCTNKKNSYWIIYTNSDFKNIEKIKAYPKIKEHLDKFKDVITSHNKPYGLHRSREENFFKNEKILSLRKCKEPTFTFSDFDCYVSQTYFIIQTERFNLKYLTAYLNSKIIKFWLRFKGKMQGKNYQIDKEPLLNIPIIKSEYESNIIQLFDDILNNEDDINNLFYEIFNLTKKEINMIESYL
ncbi:type II restriction endonuclease [Capnocytophaga sp. FDAARGOS_737]|uniref:DUF7149 domain-containing protein n=2 Tax=unclassified Capnocytophaga TaxID=2640652 RepID=UPI0012DE8027|nr:Eco57I restriction-modification methylase domain-containing protein [Capnocytophaga sp. FDAARGOS_737]QGS17812.1 type II restriction endonuclease [Capnocytophaga sp. FDAARGOS_737]